MADIKKRNAIRSEAQLPLINVEHELARLREHYEARSYGDRFHALRVQCVDEIYGLIEPADSPACQRCIDSSDPSRI